jgi:FtsP/CotA-like multicopper oxidase with cupredoxin domain
MAPGERVSALVRMSQPGVWMMGDVGDDRYSGMGIVVEYAGATGSPVWVMPDPLTWDYTRFGETGSPARPDHVIDMVFREQTVADTRFSRWLINDVSFSMGTMKPAFALRHGLRYRLRLRNASADIHPVHLHRHVFELTSIAGRPTRGIRKDVVMVGAFQGVEIDFSADRAGLSLFHCHMQHHMDNGFMALFDCR